MALTKEEFEALSPRERGYAVYMAGCRKDQPNVPNEKNPYTPKTREAAEWDTGQMIAAREAQDSEE